MKLPVQVTFRNMDRSEMVEKSIRRRAARLDTYYDSIMGCRVLVEIPHRHHRDGNPYHVRIDLTVPGGEVVVKRQPSLHAAEQQIDLQECTKCEEVSASHKQLNVAIREAFDEARRRLQDYARRQRGDIQDDERPPHGRVSKLFTEKGYGFIETSDGREIYFHSNSVLHRHFRDLEVGAEVIFAEEQGEQGPQASTVKVVGRHRGR